MNRERARELLPIIQAFAVGEIIQGRLTDNESWVDLKHPDFFTLNEYRIKPEPREFWLNPETGHFTKLIPGFLTNDWIKVREVLDDE